MQSHPGDLELKPASYVQEYHSPAEPSRIPDLLHGCENSTDRYTSGSGNLTSLEKSCRRQCPSLPIATNASIPPSTGNLASSTEIAVHKENELANGRLAQFLRSYSEPFGIQSRKMWNYDASLGSLCCWLGPIIFKRWTERGEELFGLRPEQAAYGLRLTVHSSNLYLRALNLEVFVQREIHRIEKWSIRWSLSFPKIVPKDSLVIRLASEGDVKGLKEMFETGRAGCTDTTQNGTSLLHVCRPQYGCTG